MTKNEAISLVEIHLEKQNEKNKRSNITIPVYKKWHKLIRLFLLNKFSNRFKKFDPEFPEHSIAPDHIIEESPYEVVYKKYIEDREIFWKIPYITVQYLQTKNSRYCGIGGGPIFVDKETRKIYQTGSSPINWEESFLKFKRGINEDYLAWRPLN